MKNKVAIGSAVSLLFAFGIYACCGFFVVQPIGAIPEGVTVFYWRVGLDLPFIASADGILLKKTGSVNLLTRAITIGKLSEVVKPRSIVRLPYSQQLYLYSTDGKEFSK